MLDVNDNTPAFIGEPYIFNVSEDAAQLPSEFVVYAHDPDSGANANVHYNIVEGNEEELFVLGKSFIL